MYDVDWTTTVVQSAFLFGGNTYGRNLFQEAHDQQGETAAQSLKERFAHGKNPDKMQGGESISLPNLIDKLVYSV